jgi:transcriptional regulator with XRE-family HTH domain
MADAELGLALAVLRIIRGWSQEELAKASGIRSGSISDYERNRMVPGLRTLQRLMDAMEYPLSGLSQTQRFIEEVRADARRSRDAVEFPSPANPPNLQALRREVEQVSAEAGRVVSQLARLMFAVLSQSSGQGSAEP